MLGQKLLDFFFPKRCLGCGQVGFYICSDCEPGLPYLTEQFCAVCQKPSLAGFTHLRCRRPFGPDRFLCLFSYQGLAQSLIKALKYQKVTDLGRLLAGYLDQFFRENNVVLGEQAWLTFVPLHPLKGIERGFNQSQVVAQELSRSLGVESLNLLVKVEETKSQTELKRKERTVNVKGSFALAPNLGFGLKGRDVILFDDVFTTGATLLECSRVLKRNGVRFLYLLTLARD